MHTPARYSSSKCYALHSAADSICWLQHFFSHPSQRSHLSTFFSYLMFTHLAMLPLMMQRCCSFTYIYGGRKHHIKVDTAGPDFCWQRKKRTTIEVFDGDFDSSEQRVFSYRCKKKTCAHTKHIQLFLILLSPFFGQRRSIASRHHHRIANELRLHNSFWVSVIFSAARRIERKWMIDFAVMWYA